LHLHISALVVHLSELSPPIHYFCRNSVHFHICNGFDLLAGTNSLHIPSSYFKTNKKISYTLLCHSSMHALLTKPFIASHPIPSHPIVSHRSAFLHRDVAMEDGMGHGGSISYRHLQREINGSISGSNQTPPKRQKMGHKNRLLNGPVKSLRRHRRRCARPPPSPPTDAADDQVQVAAVPPSISSQLAKPHTLLLTGTEDTSSLLRYSGTPTKVMVATKKEYCMNFDKS
jgi:hypothetical protein